MVRFIRSISLVLFLSTVWASTAVADPVAGGRYKVEIVTVDPGGELFMRWGHISIIVVDKQKKSRTAYNFGTFDFEDPALRFRYARGYLNYWLSTVPYSPMIHYYRAQRRGIVSRTLNLTPEEVADVKRKLELNLLPENRTYAYRHYLDNCCTRIRDLIDDVLGGALREKFDKDTSERTYRYYTTRALNGLPLMRNVILFILGREIDRPLTRWEEQFLPEVFGEDLETITIGAEKRPLVAETRVFYEQVGEKAGERISDWEVVVCAVFGGLLLLGFGLPILFRKRGWGWMPRIAGVGLFLWGFLAGFGGLLVILLWTATAHYDCHNNENVLVFPVFHLWLMGPGLVLLFKKRLGSGVTRWLRNYLFACLAVLGLSLVLKVGPFFQQNYQFILFAAVMNIAVIIVLKTLSSTRSGNDAGGA